MKKITSTGAIVSAIFASACCLLPVLLAGVAGIAGVSALFETLRPVFIGIAGVFLSYGFYVAYFQKQKACPPGEVCATPVGKHTQRIILWGVTIIVIVATTFPYWIQLL